MKRFFDILLGIGFIALGGIALSRPVTTLGILVFLFGGIAVIRGIFTIFGFGSFSSNESKRFRFYLGFFDILVGIILLSNMIRGALFLGIIFAAWFMIETVGNLFLNARFKQSKGFNKLLILLFDVISFSFALLLLLNPIIATMTLPKLIGFSSISFGIVLIIQGLKINSSSE